jgi:branched-chain amino acid transport system substrate-binding protein
MTGSWIRTTAAVTAIVLAGGATGCGGGDKGRGDGATGTAVKVGGIFDLSGETSDVGTPYADGIKGFVRYWNERGLTPRINLTSEDYRYEVADAKRLYSLLKRERVVALQGWGTKDTEELTADVTADRIPFMSASSAETLTDPSQTPFNFVAATSYADQIRIALRWISEQAAGAEVAFFHQDSDFGTSPLQAGEQAAKQLGLGFEAYKMPVEAADRVAQLRRARSQGATYVLIQNVATPAARLAGTIAEHAPNLKIVCLNWCADELFIELAGRAAEGTVAVMPFAPVSVKARGLAQPRAFLSQSGRTLDQEGLHYVQGWYTMALMAEGIRRAAAEGDGKVDGNSIKQALEQMAEFDTGGVSAPVDFSAASHAGMHGSKLYVVKDEAWAQLTGLLTVP